MPKYLPLLFSLLLGSLQIQAQNVRFGRAYGYNLVDIKYGHSKGPSMSSLTYENCCWRDSANISRYTKPAPVNFGAWVVNPTNSVKQNVCLKVHASPSVFYSDTISLNPGDSVKLETPSLETLYLQGCSYYVYEGVNAVAQDSLAINQNGVIDSSRLSHYFGNADNFIGTNVLGNDGSAFAILYPIDPKILLVGFSIFIGPNSITGGDVLISLYDSSAFTPSGFIGTPLYSTQLSINGAGGWHTQHFNNRVSVGSSKLKYTWLVVRMFSNGGATPFEIGNSQKVIPSDNSIWYLNTKGNNLWKKANDTTEHIMNPMFHLKTFVPHWDPAPIDFNLDEYKAKTLSLSPNPASKKVFLNLPSNWEKATVKIFSLSGMTVFETQLISGESLNTSSLKPGLYLLSAEEKGEKRTAKLLIE